MSKFNVRIKNPSETTNHEGAKAYKHSAEMELYTLAVTSILSDKYYEKGNTQLERLRELIPKVSPEFVVKLAIYARDKMYLRTLPLVLMVELVKIHKGDNLVSRGVPKVVKRADEITELLAYYSLANGRTGTKKLAPLANQIKKGLATAFNQFDEYQFGKYNRPNEIKFRDALFLISPVGKDEAQKALFDKIAEDKLETPYTWEVEISAVGQVKYDNETEKQKAFTAKWEELIDSGKLGYMALMRNLRNILDAKVSKAHMVKVCEALSDREGVLKAKQFPFRFLSAYREVHEHSSGYASMVLTALEDAVLHTASTIPGFGYETSVVIACDVSGSMQSPISPRSTVQNYDIGLMLGMLLQNNCKHVATGMFGDSWKVINVPKSQILSNVMEYHRREGEVGYSTNGYLVLDDLIKRGEVVDKVMMFTDCQLWDSRYGRGDSMQHSWNAYKKIAPNAKLYLFDLAGYGNTPFAQHGTDVYTIAGWSDKIFQMLEALDAGKSAIDVINKIEI